MARNRGIIQTFQVIDNGISKPVFYSYVKERGLDQAAHGVYVSPDTWTDAMYILHLRCSQAVFSHETALFFHDLTNREPLKYTITVRTGYNPSRLQEDGFQVYTVKKDLHETGITIMQTPFGHSVPVYDMERTICDLLRSRNNIEMQVFQDALKQYARRKDKNLRTLMKYGYSVSTTLFQMIRSKIFISDCVVFFDTIATFIQTIAGWIILTGKNMAQISNGISNPVVAGIVYWLIRILICGGCLVGAGILVAFIEIKIAELYKKCCWDMITIMVILISMATAIYFGKWIKTTLPINLLFLLLFVQLVRGYH